MSHEWDEFSKLLAEPVPRRESLRRMGYLFAGAVLAPLGLGTARAGGIDRCRSFCDRCPKSRRSSCVAACRACNNDPSSLCGNCSWGYVCTDLLFDVRNCGACHNDCWFGAGVNEEAACFDGEFLYRCIAGAVDCDGECTFLDSDPDNCGACGNVCPDSAPACVSGACGVVPDCGGFPYAYCNGACRNLQDDPHNCGACNWVCPGGDICASGECTSLPGFPDW
jgi:hypothetical protein